MDVRLLEYFIAVAELEHVGKAAQRLHVSQSPLSRQIRRLEKDLNLQLFERERQRIYLTEAGRWLLPRAKSLVANVDKLRSDVAQRADGQAGRLAVAFTSAAIWTGILPQTVKEYQAERPRVTFTLRQMRSSLQIDSIRSGRIDVGFVSTVPGDSDITVHRLAEEPFSLAIPSKHPLAKTRSISPRDLHGLRWIFLSETASQHKQLEFCAACSQAGFVPDIVQTVTEASTLLAFVEGGFGVGLVRSSASRYAPRSIIFRDLPWIPLKNGVFMIHAAHELPPAAGAFVDCVLRYARSNSAPAR